MAEAITLPNKPLKTYRLRFRLVCKKPLTAFFEKNYYPLQFKKFKFGLELQNVSEYGFPGGNISDIAISSFDQKNVAYKIYNEYQIPPLNPNETTTVWIKDIETPLEGGIWINGKFKASSPNSRIEPHQCSFRIRDEYIVYKHAGSIAYDDWGDYLFVRGKNANEQTWTNRLILLLTIITVLEAIVGLRNVWNGFLMFAGYVFLNIGNFFINLSNIFK